MNLSKAQVAGYLRKAGVSEDLIPTMVGIAGAESNFNPRAHNPNAGTGDNSYGLFQNNMLGAMGPERRRQFGLKSNEELFDPETNVRVAAGILKSQGLGAWSVYRNGRYKDYLPKAGELQGATTGSSTPMAGEALGLSSGGVQQVATAGGGIDVGKLLSAVESGTDFKPPTIAPVPGLAAPSTGSLGDFFATAVKGAPAATATQAFAGENDDLTKAMMAAVGGSMALPKPQESTSAGQGVPQGLTMGKLGGASTSWTKDPDAEQSGYDVAKPGGVGAPIVSPVELKITGKGFQGSGSGSSGKGYGNWVSGEFVDNGKRYELLLGHLNDYRVKQGDVIPAGAVIGTQGETGRTFGAHVTTHVNALDGGDPWSVLENRIVRPWVSG